MPTDRLKFEFLHYNRALNTLNAQFFTEKSINSLAHARGRESALIAALTAMASLCGTHLNPVRAIDARGEIAVTVAASDPNAFRGACGAFGPEFAAWLSKVPRRTGQSPTSSPVLPENGWCYLNHFDAERLVALFAQDLEQNPERNLERFSSALETQASAARSRPKA